METYKFSLTIHGNLPEISNIFLSNKVLTEKIEVLEPTLEDVFVRLTGRKLLEETRIQ